MTAMFDDSKKRGWLALAGLVALPMYVLPVGIWGVRALRPRLLRDSARGIITLGMLSLVAMSAKGLSRVKAGPSSDGERWRLPPFGPFMPDGHVASAASGH